MRKATITMHSIALRGAIEALYEREELPVGRLLPSGEVLDVGPEDEAEMHHVGPHFDEPHGQRGPFKGL